ncbi:MAG: DMT family transporter [Janthinobacterium lividum]
MKSNQYTTAVAMILSAMAMFAMMDASIKYLSAVASLVLVLWSRYVIQAAIMGTWLWRTQGRKGFATALPGYQLLRGFLLMSMGCMAYLSLQHMPLAEFTAIVMLAPILVTAIASWKLKEPIGALRWMVVCGGFIGTLVVIRPGSGMFGPAVIFPLLTMLSSAAYSLSTGHLAKRENPWTTQFYTGLTGTLVMLPVMVFELMNLPAAMAQFTSMHLLMLVAIGVIATVSHLVMVMAFGRSSAAALMPFTYAQIGFAAILSWLVFDHAPDALAMLGMCAIAGCGAATAWLDMVALRRPRFSSAMPA